MPCPHTHSWRVGLLREGVKLRDLILEPFVDCGEDVKHERVDYLEGIAGIY